MVEDFGLILATGVRVYLGLALGSYVEWDLVS